MGRSLLVVAALFCLWSLPARAQDFQRLPVSPPNLEDTDKDGLDDRVEEGIAHRFAPEYRFYKRVPDALLETHDPLQQALDPHATPRTASQNQTESFFPCAVDDFVRGSLPTGPVPCRTRPTIYFHSYLHKMTPSGRLAKVLMHRGWTEQIVIEYWIFYTYDSKGLNGWLDHIGDWEHIDLLIERRFDSEGSFLSDRIIDAIYYGHGTERILAADVAANRCTELVTKGIRVDARSLLLVEKTHPMVFVSSGTHASYPWPGIWQNLTCQGPQLTRVGTYDDLFLGNGRVIQGWNETTALMNLGEVPHPMPRMEWNGRMTEPPSPGLHNVWGIHDPIGGYPYTILSPAIQKAAGLGHTPWETVIRKTARIGDGLGKIRTGKNFILFPPT